VEPCEGGWKVRTAMSVVSGESLDSFIRRSPPRGRTRLSALKFGCALAAKMLCDLAPTLHLLAPIAWHRDINSHNILIDCPHDAFGEEENSSASATFCLIDFGLAVDSQSWVTEYGKWRTEYIGGDSRYWPPSSWIMHLHGPDGFHEREFLCEQYQRRLDLYGLGITATELVCTVALEAPAGDTEELGNWDLVLAAWQRYREDVWQWWSVVYHAFSTGSDIAPVQAKLVEDKLVDRLIALLIDIRWALRSCAMQMDDAATSVVLRTLADMLDERSPLDLAEVQKRIGPTAPSRPPTRAATGAPDATMPEKNAPPLLSRGASPRRPKAIQRKVSQSPGGSAVIEGSQPSLDGSQRCHTASHRPAASSAERALHHLPVRRPLSPERIRQKEVVPQQTWKPTERIKANPRGPTGTMNSTDWLRSREASPQRLQSPMKPQQVQMSATRDGSIQRLLSSRPKQQQQQQQQQRQLSAARETSPQRPRSPQRPLSPVLRTASPLRPPSPLRSMSPLRAPKQQGLQLSGPKVEVSQVEVPQAVPCMQPCSVPGLSVAGASSVRCTDPICSPANTRSVPQCQPSPSQLGSPRLVGSSAPSLRMRGVPTHVNGQHWPLAFVPPSSAPDRSTSGPSEMNPPACAFASAPSDRIFDRSPLTVEQSGEGDRSLLERKSLQSDPALRHSIDISQAALRARIQTLEASSEEHAKLRERIKNLEESLQRLGRESLERAKVGMEKLAEKYFPKARQHEMVAMDMNRPVSHRGGCNSSERARSAVLPGSPPLHLPSSSPSGSIGASGASTEVRVTEATKAYL